MVLRTIARSSQSVKVVALAEMLVVLPAEMLVETLVAPLVLLPRQLLLVLLLLLLLLVTLEAMPVEMLAVTLAHPLLQ